MAIPTACLLVWGAWKPWPGGVLSMWGLCLFVGLLLPRVGGPQPLGGQLRLRLQGCAILLILLPIEACAVLALASWQGQGLVPLVFGLGPSVAAPTLVALVLIPAVLEEWLFRGRLWDCCLRFGLWFTWLGTALAFAVVHGEPSRCVLALALGLFLGALRRRGASWQDCASVHALHNAVLLLAPGVLQRAWLLPAICAAGLVLLVWSQGLRWGVRYRWALSCGLPCVLVALWPPFRAAHDALWVQAAANVLEQEAQPLRWANAVQQQQHNYRRAQDLAQRLLHGSDQAMLLAAVVDSTRTLQLLKQHPQQAQAFVSALSQWSLPAGDALIPQLAKAQPAILAQQFLHDDNALAAWFAQDPSALGPILGCLSGAERRLLLARIGAQLGRSAAAEALLALPLPTIGPDDRRWLQQHYHDADGEIIVRFAHDPTRLSAWQVHQ